MLEKMLSRKALVNFLDKAQNSTLVRNDDTQEVLDCLQQLLSQSSPEDHSLMLLNTATCASTVLWTGADDVRFMIESGCYQEELKNFSEEQLNDFYDEVANRVDWDDVASIGISAGNNLIATAIEEILHDKS